MPDEAKPDATPTEEGASTAQSGLEKAGIPAEDVKQLVDTFTETVKNLQKPAAAPTPPPGPDPREETQKRAARYNEAKQKADELMAAGDYSAGIEIMAQALMEASPQEQVKMEDQPGYKAMMAHARKSAKADHKEVFAEYGPEIESILAEKDPGERINPESWDAAVDLVRARHVDDILKKEREALITELQGGQGVGVEIAEGGRRAPRDGNSGASKLSAEQASFAESVGLDPERYAESLEKAEKAKEGSARMRILDSPDTAKIEPGKF